MSYRCVSHAVSHLRISFADYESLRIKLRQAPAWPTRGWKLRLWSAGVYTVWRSSALVVLHDRKQTLAVSRFSALCVSMAGLFVWPDSTVVLSLLRGPSRLLTRESLAK